MSELYSSIPPERREAYLKNAKTLANEVSHEVMDPRVAALGHVVAEALEQESVRHLPVHVGDKPPFEGVGFSALTEKYDHNATWNMATGKTASRHWHPPQERFEK